MQRKLRNNEHRIQGDMYLTGGVGSAYPLDIADSVPWAHNNGRAYENILISFNIRSKKK